MSGWAELEDKILVAGQIAPADAARAAAIGVTMIVNNRPDHEQAGQVPGAAIAQAAEQAGIAYRHIPIAGGFSDAQIEAMAEAIETGSGKTLLFCLSGTRSAYLWALARHRSGADGESLIEAAAAAGYDLGMLRNHFAASPIRSQADRDP